MYVPAAFAETDPARLHAFIRRHSFAVLTSHGERGLAASHLPLLLDADAGPHGQLLGHMARANPQWRDVRGEVMAVFSKAGCNMGACHGYSLGKNGFRL